MSKGTWETGVHKGEHASWWGEPRQWRVIRYADGTYREADWLRPWSEWEWSERTPDPHPELNGDEWLDVVRAERREAMESEERARWADIETRVAVGGGTSDERAAIHLSWAVSRG